MKKLRNYIFKFLITLLVIISSYIIIAFVLSIIPTAPHKMQCLQNKQIYLSTNGVHLDFVIKQEDVPSNWKNYLNIYDTTKYVSFGWGDRGFYLETPTWSDLKASTVINALFRKSDSAMHVTRYPVKIKKWHPINLCENQLASLLEHIQASFYNTDLQHVILIPNAGYNKYDDFYQGKGSYNVITTCNTWVNRGLKKMNVKTSIWSPFDKGILYHLEKN